MHFFPNAARKAGELRQHEEKNMGAAAPPPKRKRRPPEQSFSAPLGCGRTSPPAGTAARKPRRP
ncbi:hypothetical protein CN128_24570 [Sinorhizobium meliloti]|nr:hypothetical protein CN128_24570 [Sinorhizobium meliloti]